MRLLALMLAGCSSSHTTPLPPPTGLLAARALQGELIYRGTTRDRRHPEQAPLFRYERRVRRIGDRRLSSHTTFSPDGVVVVLHEAEHTVDHALTSFHEIHAQTGLEGDVHVASDGTARFTTTRRGRTRTRTEAPGAPLHAGPTLFGHVLVNWDALVDGEVLPLRFVVLRNRRSYRFRLRSVGPHGPNQTFTMKAASPLLRLLVPTMTMVFDADRTIVRYDGLVPPLRTTGSRLRRLDATVAYDLAAPLYQ